MSQNLPKQSLRDFLFYVILTVSYPQARTIETSSLCKDSMLPLFKQIEIFSGILTYISNVSTFLNIRASYYSASSGFRLLCEIPAGANSLQPIEQIHIVAYLVPSLFHGWKYLSSFLITSREEAIKTNTTYLTTNSSCSMWKLICKRWFGLGRIHNLKEYILHTSLLVPVCVQKECLINRTRK